MSDNESHTFFVVGETSLAAHCVEFLLEKGWFPCGLVSDDPDLQEWSNQHQVPLFDDFISLPEFDFLLSIVNPRILPNNVIQLANKLAINYHDSPLPAYAGVHSTSWAILNHEKSHGITWHVIAEQIDGGEVLKQVFFPIEVDETAFSLNIKCYQHALQSFKELIVEIEENRCVFKKQDLINRSYFGSHKKPKRAGMLSWEEEAADIEILFRATDFGNYPNRFCVPKVFHEEVFFPTQVQLLDFSSGLPAGTVVERTESQLQVTTKTQDVLLFFGRGDLQKTALAPGDRLSVPQNLPQLEDFFSELSRYEKFWVKELQRANYLDLGGCISSGFSSEAMVELPSTFSGEVLITAVLAYFYRISGQSTFTVDYHSDLPDEPFRIMEKLVITDLPLTVSFSLQDTFASIQEKVTQLLKLLNKNKCYTKDLILRHPQLSGMTHSTQKVLVQFVDAIQSCVLPERYGLGVFISLDEGKCRLISSNSASLLLNSPQHLSIILENRNSNKPLAFLPLLAPAEKEILLKWSGTGALGEQKEPLFLHQLIERHASDHPSALSVVCDEMSLTYRELDAKAEELCLYLKSAGVGPEVNVAICMEKAPALVIAILAVLKSGGSFVPLDPNHPKERLSYVIEETQALLVLTQSPLKELFTGSSALCYTVDQSALLGSQKPLREEGNPLQLSHRAYVLYTSGSAGRPKGVEVEHLQLIHAIRAKEVHYNLKSVKSLWVGSIGFDVSISTILYPLVTGGTLYFSAKVSNTDPDGIINLLRKHEVNHFCCAVSLYALLLTPNRQISCPALKQVSVGGETLPDALVVLHENYFPQAFLFNEYGPTECTVWCSYAKVYDPVLSLKTPVSIGKPIQHAQMYLLDENRQLLPMGVKGEIYVGGLGVARGYVNDPELTQKAFIPASPFGRLYKTGDLGRWQPDGQLCFLGRTDQQVKFRGYRIELEEIERVLAKVSGVQQAVVCLKREGTLLVAYLVLVPDFPLPSQRALRDQLQKFLPEYMIPSLFVFLDELPLTLQGKVDRKTLPDPSPEKTLHESDRPPETHEEKFIAAIWSQLLKVGSIGPRDNFFELGGHSLLALQVIIALQNALQIELPLKALYEHSTLEGFARFVSQLKTQRSSSSVESYPELISDPSHRFSEFPLTDIQEAYWIGRNEVFTLSQIAVHGYSEYDFELLDVERLEKSWNQLIRRHEALRLVFTEDGTQKILSDVPYYSIPCFDFSKETDNLTQDHLDRVKSRLSHQVLPSTKWPLFEICVTHLKDRYRLHFSIDGLIVDGWSFNILLSEWAKIYLCPDLTLGSLEVSFRDYVLTERLLKQSSLYQRDKNYWMSKLSDFPVGPSLPLARHPKEIGKPTFHRCTKKLNRCLWKTLQEEIRSKGVTPTSFLLTLFGQVLQFWSPNPRFSIVLTLFNRLPFHSQINEIVGDFTSITVCEIDNRGQSTFFERNKKLQDQLFSDIDHRLFSGLEVLRELNRQNQSSWDNPLIPVVFTSLLAEEPAGEEVSFAFNPVYSITQTPQVWLDYKAYNQSSDLVIEWDYVEGLFPENLIDEMHQAYFGLLEKLAQSSEAWEEPHFDLVLGKQRIRLNSLNATARKWKPSLLQELFHDKARAAPDQTAVIYGEILLSYKELQEQSNQLGRYLRRQGALPNRLIAVVMDKCPEQVIGCLGILNAGSAYLPINIDFPEERIVELLVLGEVEFILTQERYLEKLRSLVHVKELNCKSLISIDGPRAEEWNREESGYLEPVQAPHDLAYVIFTSGSTGVPKGVMIDHQGVVNTLLDINERFAVDSRDRVLALSNLNFDLSVYDLFGLLAAGGTIVLPCPEDVKEPGRWKGLLERHKVTLWNSVPMFMSMFVEYLKAREEAQPIDRDLRLVLLSGDWIPLDLPPAIKEWFPRSDVISLGGATEASIWSIIYPIRTLRPEWRSIPYGLPLVNQEMYVLNEYLQPCPDWVQGDIYIGGMGLAKGYWKDAARTEAQFIFHTEWKKRLYKTGDLGRTHPDGLIEFLGRSDDQVKISGYRMELGEIHRALESHPDISQVLVTSVGERGKEKQLMAYLVLNDNRTPEIQRTEIVDRLERMRFRLSQANIRTFPKSHKNVPLRLKEEDSSKLFHRKSYRRYDGNRLSVSALIGFLLESADLFKQIEGSNIQAVSEKISFQKFENFLRPLMAVSVATQPLPKYAYPSAGSLYPVQTYIRVKNISEMEPGLYYLSPVAKKLYPVEDDLQSLGDFEEAFTVYLVGKASAIQPLYGDLWREFCQLEIGYICHLLRSSAMEQGLSLTRLQSEVIQSSKGGSIEAVEPVALLGEGVVKPGASLPSEMELYLYLQPDALSDLAGGWYDLDEKAGKLICRNNSIPFVPTLATTEYYSILREAPFTLFLVSDSKGKSQTLHAGMFSQFLMEKGVQEGIGFCPIGTLDDACRAQCHKVLGRKQILHILTGGPISRSQLQEVGSSLPKPPEMRLSEDLQLFLKSKLPDYSIPSFFMVLERFPLSANGKIDRRSLPLPNVRQMTETQYIPPRTDIEKKLACIWSEILKVERIGVQDHFFHLGGHSLAAVQLVSSIRKVFGLDFSIKQIFRFPILETLSAQIADASEQASKFVYPKIMRVSRDQHHPLSFSQQRLWFLDQLLDNKAVYNISLAFHLRGPFSIARWMEAWKRLIEHREIFRTVFPLEGGTARQAIMPTQDLDFCFFDLSEEPSAVEKHQREEALTPFDLSKGPLVRGRLLKLERESHLLLFTLHHIITDEWSLRLVLKELSDFYNCSQPVEEKKVPDPIEFVDFAWWQQGCIKNSLLEKQLLFWRKELENSPDLLQLPTDRPRPQNPTYQGAIHVQTIALELATPLRKLAEQRQATLFMLLIGAFQLLLARYSGQTDILVGFPVANRHYPGVETLLGYFANTVVLRTKFDLEDDFSNVLSQIREKTTRIYDNQDIPFEFLVDDLKITRDLSRHPLFQVMFVYRNAELTGLRLHGVEVESFPVNDRVAKFDLTLTAEETPHGIKIEFEYATDLFEANTIERMAQNFIELLKNLVKDPAQQIRLLGLVSEREYDQIVRQWNATERALVPSLCLHQLFEKQATQTPDQPALLFEGQTLTYSELNNLANRLACYLIKLKISTDSIVGIGLNRSIELVISIYAIMKAGGAYLPLELSYPKDRLNYMLEDAKVTVILTLKAHCDQFSNFKGTLLLIDELELEEEGDCPDVEHSLSSLAYVIYTSGSTGLPKGVCIEHGGLTNRVLWMQHECPLSFGDRVLQKTPFSFDVSVWEFFWPLAFGATLVIASPEIHRNAEALIQTIQQNSITCLHFVPSMLGSFLELQGGQKCPSLNRVFASGEALSASLARDFFEQTSAELYNLYGPTEASIDVTFWKCRRFPPDQTMPIGKPIWNIETYVLDDALHPVPIGVPGELYLSGVGLARCYLNKPNLTAERFIQLPFKPEKRAYKTGDLVRYLSDGNIEFLGRLDHQVKVRGYRIELCEIEKVLCNHPDVLGSVVDVFMTQTGHKSLVAYVILKNVIEERKLRDYLVEKVPDYMVPSQFLIVEQFPLTVSGKVDRRALLQNTSFYPRGIRSVVFPRNDLESDFVQIWKEVLQLERVGVSDNFFELGGDSILAIQIVAVAKMQGYFLQLADLFRWPTIDKLSHKVSRCDSKDMSKSYEPFSLIDSTEKQALVSKRLEDAYPLSSLQAGMIYYHELNVQATLYQDTFSYEIEGELREDLLYSIVSSQIAIHPALRTSFHFDDSKEPLQWVHGKGKVQITFEDLSGEESSVQDQMIEHWFHKENESRFEIDSSTLIRFTVHKTSDRTFNFGFTFHHAILDGWSVATLVTEIFQEYEARIEGRPFSPRHPRLSYGAYIQRERQFANTSEQSDFWELKLQDFRRLEVNDPFKKEDPVQCGFSESRVFVEDLVEALRKLSKRLNVPLKSVLLAAYLRVLSRISGENDITTGYILNGRLEEFDSENILGLFLNTLPLRVRLDGGTWEDLVRTVYEEEQELLPRRWYPLSQIQKQHPGVEIFNTSFNYAHFHVYERLKDNRHIRIVDNKAYERTNFTFSANFYVDPFSDHLCLSLEYDSSKIGEKKIEEIFVYFENALNSLAYHSSSLYQKDSLLSERELHLLLHGWNETEQQIDQTGSVMELFQKQVKENAKGMAVLHQGQSLTYQQLDNQVDRIARFLRTTGPSVSLVALSATRSIELVIGWLGILKAGKSVLPLDPSYPSLRLESLLRDSEALLLLTQNHLKSKFENYRGQRVSLESLLCSAVPSVEEAFEITSQSSTLAYLLYTSGSTGTPKGVLVEHGALVNQIQWLQHTFRLTASDRVLQHSSLAFDVSVEEILWPLCCGATVVMAPQDIHQNIEAFIDLIASSGITILDLVPSLLETILQHARSEPLKTLRQVLVGGEILHSSLVKQFYERSSASLHNMYGLTETTITSTCCPCARDVASEDPSLGFPIWNTKTYILDKHLCPLPIGVAGEICVSGGGLARGYLGHQELTQEKFVPNPFTKESTLLFRTGDLGYFRPDGSIKFLGRSDSQIKMRGQRIELLEIESALKQHVNVDRAIVVLKEDNTVRRLIAYVVLKNNINLSEKKVTGQSPHGAESVPRLGTLLKDSGQRPQSRFEEDSLVGVVHANDERVSDQLQEELKKWLRQSMPEGWIPSLFVFLTQFPLLPNGKVDRQALLKIEFSDQKRRIVPKTPLERVLAEIWCDVLRIREVGIDDNFFALGGNSLSITVVAMLIRKRISKNIPLEIFLENPTIATLSSLLDKQKVEERKQSFAFEEVSLPSTLMASATRQKWSLESPVLLTGATGFLGIHLLLDLLENSEANVFCLVRARNRGEATAKLVENFGRYFPNAVFPRERVMALPGDLGVPRLGLEKHDYESLSKQVGWIYHCGALVNHVYDYKTLLSPNVLSVIEVLTLATTEAPKKVVYVSTLSTAATEQGEIQETFLPASRPYLISGYEQTKWMAERLLTQASERGIPIHIFRPSTLIGHSVTGISSYEKDHLLRLVKGCIQMGKAPDWDLKLDLLPVDFVSKAIVKIALEKANESNVFNLSNHQKLNWIDLIDWINKFGYRIDIIPYHQWKDSLSAIGSHNALFPLLSLYLGAANLEKFTDNKIATRNTLSVLSKLGISMPSIDDHILNKMFGYLAEMFLEGVSR